VRTHPVRIALAFLLILSVALPAGAYVYPLSSTAIRDAFMTGQRNDQQTEDFFRPYSHTLPMPPKGPHVAIVMLQTPFYQVVANTMKPNYHSNQAERDFLGLPLDVILRVQVDYTATYPVRNENGSLLDVEPIPDFLHDFKVTLSQDKQGDVKAKLQQVSLIFTDASTDLYGVTGAILEFHFDPDKIDSDDATITVDTPDGQHVETTFNLLRLR
jgi:hypothetical protein